MKSETWRGEQMNKRCQMEHDNTRVSQHTEGRVTFLNKYFDGENMKL